MYRVGLIGVLLTTVLAGALMSGGPPAETAFPGQNGRIVFRSDRTGDDEIWAMGADGSNQTNLTNTDGFDHDPQWSPDGTKVAYFSCRENESCEIYVMNADGSGQTRITDSPEDDYDPAWSPDGTKIAISQEVDPEIYVMDASGGPLVNLTNNNFFDGDPAWSPDGSKIAFTTGRDGNAEVYVIDAADGSNPTNLTNLPSSGENNAAWSPDGSMIAYTSQDDGDIWVMNADGSNKMRLTTDSAWDDDAAWSPDGTMIAFTSERDDDDGDVHVIPLTGVSSAGGDDGAVNITNSPGYDGVPDWGREPDPTPTPSPSPTPTQAPGLAGDADCDQEVDSVDALHVLRHVAGLGDSACIDDGNVKCDDDITSVDSLFILRYVALLPANVPQGCPEIGT
jgi:TolB protein